MTLVELQTHLKAAALIPVFVENDPPGDQKKRLMFSESLPEYLEAVKAFGSQQIQGEVLELALEDGLRRAFPLDVIDEVKKGQRGGDVLRRVMTRLSQPAGVVLWETKRAKDFSPVDREA